MKKVPSNNHKTLVILSDYKGRALGYDRVIRFGQCAVKGVDPTVLETFSGDQLGATQYRECDQQAFLMVEQKIDLLMDYCSQTKVIKKYIDDDYFVRCLKRSMANAIKSTILSIKKYEILKEHYKLNDKCEVVDSEINYSWYDFLFSEGLVATKVSFNRSAKLLASFVRRLKTCALFVYVFFIPKRQCLLYTN